MATLEELEKERQEKKRRFIDYYSALPIKKLAAQHIGLKTTDTINDWEKDDPEFSAQIVKAEADWANSNASKVKSREWLLERVMKNHFAQRTELTGAEGKELPTPILGGAINVQIDNGSSENKQLIEADKGSVGGDIGEQDDRDITELN